MTEPTFPQQRQGREEERMTGREEVDATFGVPAPQDDIEFEPTIVRGRE